MQPPTKVAAQGLVVNLLNSITKRNPVFNEKTGTISYSWEDLKHEKPTCPHCRKNMSYWYSRKRGVIISDAKYVFMAPRFKCPCGCTLTMRPYFILWRKQYSIFSIQDILNADISSDRSCSASYGSLEVMRLRRWAVALVKNMGCNDLRMTTTEEREVIKEQISCYGASWLSSHIQKDVGCASFFIPP